MFSSDRSRPRRRPLTSSIFDAMVRRPTMAGYFEPQGEDIGHMHKWVQHPQPPSAGPDETVFRILCPESKAGGVIGKGGSIVSQIRQETGVRVTAQETVQGCEERVIIISMPEDVGNNGGDLGKVLRAQEALFRVHGRIFEDIVDENNSNNLITTRLVVPNGQVGCLLGKGGKIIQQTREETKVHIRILPREMTSPCVLTTDEILQVHYTVEVTPQAWQLLSIFLSTIAGLVLSPLPVGVWAFLGLTTAVITRTLSFSTAFSAFTNEVIWLIVISFFFARGFVKTGLGDRIATYFVKWLGKSTLGLSYSLTISEALIAPAMPSTTARAGGVFLPIIKCFSLSGGSLPNDKWSKKLGSYLIQSQFQCWCRWYSINGTLLANVSFSSTETNAS